MREIPSKPSFWFRAMRRLDAVAAALDTDMHHITAYRLAAIEQRLASIEERLSTAQPLGLPE